ncbi:hypothetical protein ACIQCM_03720 [Pseudarthrobacter sp. NPDC092439]|uniref:hypothetical protein n=1 Tax=unclassified Pseudarthrobacter TaxID=2647000 RepID=UPI0037FDE283
MKKMGLRLAVLLIDVTGSSAPARHPADHPERGDVPGWVMITLMSAVLVAALLALAGPALETMFNQAMDRVGS